MTPVFEAFLGQKGCHGSVSITLSIATPSGMVLSGVLYVYIHVAGHLSRLQNCAGGRPPVEAIQLPVQYSYSIHMVWYNTLALAVSSTCTVFADQSDYSLVHTGSLNTMLRYCLYMKFTCT